MICVFDIESVPDIELVRGYFGLDSGRKIDSDVVDSGAGANIDKRLDSSENLSTENAASSIAICEAAFAAQKEKSGSEFLPIFLHKIVSISSVICDDYGHFVKVGNFGKGGDERAILQDFIDYINKKEPRLVSFNGRGFDIPAIMLRAMRYNICANGFYEVENPARTKNKWENYRARYSEQWHTDLLDTLGHFGSVRGLNLDGVCKMLGIVGKYDVSGSDVYKIYYAQNDLAKIDEYCQSDVLNTYWLYLKYAILKGELTLGDYSVILQEWSERMPKDRGYSEAFCQNIQKELGKLGRG